MPKQRVWFTVNIDSGKDGRMGKGGRRSENFNDLAAAERSARALLRHDRGRVVSIYRTTETHRTRNYDRIAMVVSDAFGRIWTDSLTMEGLI